MRVEILPGKNYVTVYKDIADRKFYAKESTFLYHVKKCLQAMGYDCIKKLAHKDGNLVSDDMYYIRDRKARWYIYDNHHAVRFVSEAFDRDGEVKLLIGEVLVK